MAWIEMRLRGAKVWMRTDDQGQPAADAGGRVEVVYRPGGKAYRAARKNLEELPGATLLGDDAMPSAVAAEATAGPSRQIASPTPKVSAKAAPSAADAILVYTDGACTGNPGPMGIGAVILDPDGKGPSGSSAASRRELSIYLGTGTNNIAELSAIQRGIAELPRERPVVVFSDSSYSIGVLSQGWKARANQELVADIRRLIGEFVSLRFVKVAGHAGVPENERCDELARQAIVRRGR